MRKLFFLLVIGAGVFTYYRYAPSGTAHRLLSAVGISTFIEETAPSYLRTKLSIQGHPVERRKKLLAELSENITSIERELQAAVPPVTDGAPTAKPAVSQDLPARVERARSLLAESEEKIAELEEANPQQGFLIRAAERLLGTILPPDGVGGDGTDSEACAQKR